jgi:hypothetical protein
VEEPIVGDVLYAYFESSRNWGQYSGRDRFVDHALENADITYRVYRRCVQDSGSFSVCRFDSRDRFNDPEELENDSENGRLSNLS